MDRDSVLPSYALHLLLAPNRHRTVSQTLPLADETSRRAGDDAAGWNGLPAIGVLRLIRDEAPRHA